MWSALDVELPIPIVTKDMGLHMFRDQIKHYPGFMSVGDAAMIHSYAKSVQTTAFDEFGNDRKEFSVNVFKNPNTKESNIRDVITTYGKMVYDTCIINYGGPFVPFEPAATHIAKFEAGYGMHEHFDAGKPNDIATLIYINDDYEGGEIYFPELGVEIKPKAGDLIMFPDNPNFIHGVKPITSGVRFTTPRWFTRIV